MDRALAAEEAYSSGCSALDPAIGHGQGSIGPALSIRAHGEDRRFARYESTSRTATVRVGSLTWTVQDRAAADSMREAWRYMARTVGHRMSRLVTSR
jgi:hypothetical protein